jgi:uracil-DNA glycosylase
MGIEDYWQTVYSNWYHNSPDCAGCKANDGNNYWTPYFARGSAEPDVLFLGIDPGGAYGPNEKEMPRFYKDEVRDTGGYEAPTPDEWQRETDPTAVPDGADGFAEKLLELDGSVEITFTNIKKCSEIRDPSEFETEENHSVEYDRGKYNSKAETNCSEAYLAKELDLLSPKIICTFGKAKDYLLPHYGISPKQISDHSELIENGLLKAYTEPQTILPVYHFSQRWANVTDGIPEKRLKEIKLTQGYQTDMKEPYQRLVAESIYAHL